MIFFFLFSEEIAFYNGNVREKQTIHATFKKLVGNWLAVFVSPQKMIDSEMTLTTASIWLVWWVQSGVSFIVTVTSTSSDHSVLVYSFTSQQQGDSRGVELLFKISYSFRNVVKIFCPRNIYCTNTPKKNKWFKWFKYLERMSKFFHSRTRFCASPQYRVFSECEQNNFLFQVDHLHNFIFFRFSMGFVDSIIAKCK